MYHRYGISNFVICAGYMGHVIKKFFADYFINNSGVTFDMRYHTTNIHSNSSEPWKVTIVDTGAESMTGGRLLRVRKYVEGETFCMTYGDGVSDVDITGLLDFHRNHGKLATLTAVHPPGRFGVVKFHNDGETNRIETFSEKTDGEKGMINGGFFVLEPRVLDYIRDGDKTIWE